MSDPVLVDSWLAVGNATAVAPGGMLGVDLLDRRVVVWRTADGSLHAADDQCPHRGAQLSLGGMRDDLLVCPYHGWRYDGAGRCALRPATPDVAPPRSARLRTHHVRERYGVVWVCLGTPPGEPDFFPEHDEPGMRHVHHEPVLLHACGPRIIENFLDMAHFPFVHGGILGAEPHTEVRPYRVASTAAGLEATGCLFWQPAATPTAGGGADVEYSYRVPHPYVATLRKIPRADVAGFSLMLVVSPADEVHCRAWMVAAYGDTTVDERDFHDFNQRIFDQDIPVVESQRPHRLPLDPGAELHQPADRVSQAYRRHLAALGLRYGTSLGDRPPAGPAGAPVPDQVSQPAGPEGLPTARGIRTTRRRPR